MSGQKENTSNIKEQELVNQRQKLLDEIDNLLVKAGNVKKNHKSLNKKIIDFNKIKKN